VISVNPAERPCVVALKEVIKAKQLPVQDAAFLEGRFEMGPISLCIFEIEN
jgi:hypothetical protein